MSNTNPLPPVDARFLRNFSAFPQDQVRAIRPTHHYEGQVTLSNAKIQTSLPYETSVRMIDDAISIESVDEKTRQAAINYFNYYSQQTSEEQKNRQNDFYKGIGVTVVGTGLTIGAIFLSPVTAIAFASVGISMAALGIVHSTKSHTALKEIHQDLGSLETMKNQWQDPIQGIVAHRKNSNTQGFPYVFANQLKGSVIHPEEAEALWIRDFKHLLNNHSHIAQVFSDDLLGHPSFSYAWSDRSPSEIAIPGRIITPSLLDAMTMRYRECHQVYSQFTNAIDQKLQLLQQEKNQISKTIQTLRNKWYEPGYNLHLQGIAEAKQLYQQAITPFIRQKEHAIAKVKQDYRYIVSDFSDQEEVAYGHTCERLCREAINKIESEFKYHPAVIVIEDAYSRDCRMYDFLHAQSKLLVDSFFDQRIRQLDSEVIRSKQIIEAQHLEGTQHLSNLLDKILTTQTDADLVNMRIIPPTIQFTQTLNHFVQEPSWNEVYGRTPQFQSHFAGDVSEYTWNLFWGNHGLGLYASCPTNSWGSLFNDRKSFTHDPRILNLHTTQHLPSTGIFYQSVKVPPPPLKIHRAPVGERQQPVAERREPNQERRVPVGEKTHVSEGYGSTTRR